MSFKSVLPPVAYQQATTLYPYRFRGAARVGAGEVRVDGKWSIALDRSCGALGRLAADDLRALMKATFGYDLKRRAAGGPVIGVRVDAEAGGGSEAYRLRVGADGIDVAASDDVAAMRALFHLGREMLNRRAPILSIGRWRRSPRWSLRITTSAVHGGRDDPQDYLDLPKPYLLNLARFGYNAMYIYMDWFDLVPPAVGGPLARSGWKQRVAELNRAAEYMLGYGVQLLFHVNTLPLRPDHPYFRKRPRARGAQSFKAGLHCLCSSEPEVLDFYRNAARRLFTDAPALAGLVLITGGECLINCYTRPIPKTGKGTNCPRCARKSPDRVIADVVNAISRGTREVRSDAHVLMWPYSAFTWGTLDQQKALLKRLDPDVGLIAAYAKDGSITIDGTRGYVWDYSISQMGPSPRFRALKRAAASCGVKTYAKTETSTCIEMFNIPRIPIMHRWAERFQKLRGENLEGLHAGWRFYGFCAQRTDEILDYFNWAQKPDAEAFLRTLAIRDFGPVAARAVVRAWKNFSDAFELFPYCAGVTGFPYFRGPLYIGAAHPFLFDLTAMAHLSPRFWAPDPCMEEGLVDEQLIESTRRPIFFVDLTWTQPFGAATMTDRLGRMSKRWDRGIDQLGRAGAGVRGAERARLDDELTVARWIGSMFHTASNLVRFQVLRDAVTKDPCTPARLRATCGRALSILQSEMVNAREALEIFERNTRFGYTSSYGRAFDADLIREKIEHTRHQIEEAVPAFYANHAFHCFGRFDEIAAT